jgi:hypothetical protein
MRCNCCNRPLSNSEATRKFSSGTFTDMCNHCLETISEDVECIDSDIEDDIDDGEGF